MPVSLEDRWKEVHIPEGVSYAQGISILKNEGIIKNEYIFFILGKLFMMDKRLIPGFYNMNTSMSPIEIFRRLMKGMIVQYTISIPEGAALRDIKPKFIETGLMDENSWKLASDREFLDSLNIDAPTIEGYIYPDTYSFAKGAYPGDIFRIMVQRMREHFNEKLRERAEELGMSEREILTLASIIEKEAQYDRERPLISAVYHNRLKKNMKLQADPTVNYGTKRFGYRIRTKDLKRRTPYNTYVIKGLPPGPIASPGIKSIKAALFPADVNYLYFVSKNDGTHYFSNNGEDHMRAVYIYQQGGNKEKIDVEEETD
jgi:UPF0755 protein